MKLAQVIQQHNEKELAAHQRRLAFLQNEIQIPSDLIQKLKDFQIAIPSWALGTGGTRFGRFSGGENPEIWKKKLRMLGCCMP